MWSEADRVVNLFIVILVIIAAFCAFAGYDMGVRETEIDGVIKRADDKLLVACEDGHTEWIKFPTCRGK
jgi:hypothetical protein